MTQNSDFQNRLKKLGHKPSAEPVTQAPNAVKSGWFYAFFSVFALIGAGTIAALTLNVMAPKSGPMDAVTSAFLIDEELPSSTSALGGIDLPLVDQDYLQSCLRFLPPAPEGWVRVTTWDARFDQVLPKLDDAWRSFGKSFPAATGYPQLTRFIERYAGQDAKATNNRAQNTISSAIYMDIGGDGYFQITMLSRPWRDSNTCKEEFLNQWEMRDPTQQIRFPLLDQFSYDSMEQSEDDVPTNLLEKGYRKFKNFVEVSEGLSIFVAGIHRRSVVTGILDGDFVGDRVAQALQDG